MVGKKSMRTRGKIQLSRYFQEFQPGEKVSVIRERAVNSEFPSRLQGRTGIIETARGRSYVVKIKDSNKEKRFIIEPIHLKKIKSSEK